MDIVIGFIIGAIAGSVMTVIIFGLITEVKRFERMEDERRVYHERRQEELIRKRKENEQSIQELRAGQGMGRWTDADDT